MTSLRQKMAAKRAWNFFGIYVPPVASTTLQRVDGLIQSIYEPWDDGREIVLVISDSLNSSEEDGDSVLQVMEARDAYRFFGHRVSPFVHDKKTGISAFVYYSNPRCLVRERLCPEHLSLGHRRYVFKWQ